MKKIVFALLTIISTCCLQAQNSVDKTQGSFQIGVKGGFNFHGLSGPDTEGDVGLVVGAWGNYMLTDLIGLQGELLYLQQGASRRVDVLGIDFTTEFNLDYLAIPLMISIHPVDFINLHGEFNPASALVRPQLFLPPLVQRLRMMV